MFVVLYTVSGMLKSPEIYYNRLRYNDLKSLTILIISFLLLGFSNNSNNLYRSPDAYNYTLFYNQIFNLNLKEIDDPLFYIFMYICKSIGISVDLFFLLCAVIYCSTLFLMSKKIGNKFSGIYFLMIVSSFSFVAYGTNVIRNGFALSFVLLACTFYREKLKMIILFIIALLFHMSAALPIMCFFVSFYFKRTRVYIYIWLLTLLVSFFLGNHFFDGLHLDGIMGSRMNGYLDMELYKEVYKRMGFRIDFVLYSFIPIVFASYFILKKKFESKYYILIVNTYLLSNAAWLLVIRIPFSDRFAALSWFFIPQILLYPLIERKNERNRITKIAGLLFLNFVFAYVMFLKKM